MGCKDCKHYRWRTVAMVMRVRDAGHHCTHPYFYRQVKLNHKLGDMPALNSFRRMEDISQTPDWCPKRKGDKMIEIKKWGIYEIVEDKFILSGNVYNHPRFPNGEKIRTSAIRGVLSKTEHSVIIETRNTTYLIKLSECCDVKELEGCLRILEKIGEPKDRAPNNIPEDLQQELMKIFPENEYFQAQIKFGNANIVIRMLNDAVPNITPDMVLDDIDRAKQLAEEYRKNQELAKKLKEFDN